jgi:hypothetical protein
MDIYARRPALLPLVHGKHRSGVPLFAGESSLHILAANRHEDELRTAWDQGLQRSIIRASSSLPALL